MQRKNGCCIESAKQPTLHIIENARMKTGYIGMHYENVSESIGIFNCFRCIHLLTYRYHGDEKLS